MGNSCCEETNDQGKVFETEDIPRMNEYYESQWPADDYFLNSRLASSNIVNLQSKEKPLKHKIYDRWYWGDWSNGQPKGKGIVYNKAPHKSVLYEGEFDGEPHGRGKFVFNDGESEYEGEVHKGKADGKGYYKNNRQDYEFNGEWKNSIPYKGQLTVVRKNLTTGKREKVEIQLAEEHKPSQIFYPDGRIYIGNIDRQKFVPHGHGRVTFPNHSSYEGEWKHGQMHGKGRFEWPDGSSYEGAYENGKKHGQGRFVFASGNYHQGFWENGQQHGKGILYSKESKQLETGVWKNGEFFGHL